MMAQNQPLVPQQAPPSALSQPHPPLVEEEAVALEEVAVEADIGVVEEDAVEIDLTAALKCGTPWILPRR